MTSTGLPISARAFLAATTVVALVAGALAPAAHGNPLTYAAIALAVAAAAAQLFVVNTPRNQAYHITLIFLVPAVMLLPPQTVALIAVLAHVPEWLKERYPWFIQGFNIANNVVDLLAACAVATFVAGSGHPGGARFGLAAFAAVTVYVVLNHGLLATMLKLARGHSFGESGLFTIDNLAAEFVLGAIGVVLAALWRYDAWLIPAALAPLVLIHRSLEVPELEQQARVDSKTGLFNARHFSDELRDELAKAERLGRPFALLLADLDYLRTINNTHGHLAGDAVLCGIADILRREVRHYDVPARFGGEEFAVLLPETEEAAAMALAERIRRAVEAARFAVETSATPLTATISIGVATYPEHAVDLNELIHHADVAVYAAKARGRNRVVSVSDGVDLAASVVAEATVDLAELAPRSAAPLSAVAEPAAAPPRPRAGLVGSGPRLVAFRRRLRALVVGVALGGTAAGVLGVALAPGVGLIVLAALAALVAGGEALSLELEGGSVSISVVGALAGAAIAGPEAALPLAVVAAAMEWSTHRSPMHKLAFNVGALSLASLAAAGVTAVAPDIGPLGVAASGVAAGAVYFLVNTGLVALAIAFEEGEPAAAVWQTRFAWLLPHYLGFGAAAGAMALAHESIGLLGLVVFALPLALIRYSMASYLRHTLRSAQELREATETIRRQSTTVERANRLLRERSTAAMESLSATVDARDAYTAGHSRRVQWLALAIGRRLGISDGELETLGHAALFHDIGKLAVPDSILLKPSRLTDDEWLLMRRHADEGARIIERLGFLDAAIPSIRHHHERFDGSGYPLGLSGDEIALGARIIHVADAVDSMLSDRVYRSARPLDEVLEEVAGGAGKQFCPACANALVELAGDGLLSGLDGSDAGELAA